MGDGYAALRNIDLNTSKSLLLNASYGRKTDLTKRMRAEYFMKAWLLSQLNILFGEKNVILFASDNALLKENYFAPTAQIAASHWAKHWDARN